MGWADWGAICRGGAEARRTLLPSWRWESTCSQRSGIQHSISAHESSLDERMDSSRQRGAQGQAECWVRLRSRQHAILHRILSLVSRKPPQPIISTESLDDEGGKYQMEQNRNFQRWDVSSGCCHDMFPPKERILVWDLI